MDSSAASVEALAARGTLPASAIESIPLDAGYVPSLFLPVAYSMLLDSRLSPMERNLYLYLRMRMGTNGRTLVSNKTIAQDIGVTERTVEKHMSSLRKKRFVITVYRGYGQTTYKIAKSPEQMFDTEALNNPAPLLLSSRTPDDLRKLRSEDRPERIFGMCRTDLRHVPNGSSGELDKEDNKIKIELDKVLVSLPKSDDQGNTKDVPMDFPQSKKKPLPTTREVSLPVSKIRPTGRPVDPEYCEDRRDPKVVLAEAAARAAESAQARSQKRQERLARPENIQGTPEHAARLEAAGRLKAKRLEGTSPANQFKVYCRRVFKDCFPDVDWIEWGHKEWATAKGLLRRCNDDLELVKSLWMFTCHEWARHKEKLRLEGFPRIGILSSGYYFEQINGAFQERKLAQSKAATKTSHVFGTRIKKDG